MSTSALRCGGELVEQVVGLDAEALAAADLDERPLLVFIGERVAEVVGAARRHGHHLVGEVGVVVGGLGEAHAAQRGDDVVLRVVLAGVDDVVDGVGVAEGGAAGIAGAGGRDPAGVRRIVVELFVAEVLAGQQAELPEVVGDVLADIGDGAVGADDDLGVFVGALRVTYPRRAARCLRLLPRGA